MKYSKQRILSFIVRSVLDKMSYQKSSPNCWLTLRIKNKKNKKMTADFKAFFCINNVYSFQQNPNDGTRTVIDVEL